jgi:hypothetical protein
MQTLQARADMLEIELELLKNKFSVLQRRADWQDNQCRRLNLIFTGITRTATTTETSSQCAAKVGETLYDVMGVARGEVRLDHVTRLTNGSVLVRFMNVRDKLHVLSRARHLSGTPVRVREDFSQRVQEIRKGLLRLRDTYRREGKRAVLRFDKLYTDFDIFTFDLSTRSVVKVTTQPRPSSSSSAHAQYLTLNLQRLRAQQERRQRGSVSSAGSLSD